MNEVDLLRGGLRREDPRLGRVPEFDERSRNYPVRIALPAQVVKGRTWMLPKSVRFDQGIQDGIPNYDASGCTGYSRAVDLACYPSPYKLPSDPVARRRFAHALYRLAQQFDEWAGDDYEGSSVLGALKACAHLGFIGEYRWAFGIDDVCLALAQLGPVTVGTDWLWSMFNPKPNGLLEVDPSSRTAGGHAYTFRGIIVNRDYMRRLLGRGEQIRSGVPLLRMTNTWWEEASLSSWGINGGEAFMWADDLELLLKGIVYPGEASVVTKAFKQQRP